MMSLDDRMTRRDRISTLAKDLAHDLRANFTEANTMQHRNEKRTILLALILMPCMFTAAHLTASPDYEAKQQSQIAAELQRARPEIQGLLSEFSPAEFRNRIVDLQNFGTRYARHHKSTRAAEYIYRYFQALGLETRYQMFSRNTQPPTYSRNVVATQRGKNDPSTIIVIGAHYDSMNALDARQAPGADDNASGVAAVLEAARLLSSREIDFTIRYVAFADEELGLVGSRVFAARAAHRGEKIVAVLLPDMIAYADAMPEDLNLVSNLQSRWLGDLFAAVTEVYTTLPVTHTVDDSATRGDFYWFWQNHYPAIFEIEDYPIRNPYYHSRADTVDTLNMTFGSDVGRASLAGLAVLGQLHNPRLPKCPTGLTLRTSVDLTGKNVFLSWTAPSSEIIGYNVFRSRVSHFRYKKLTPQPISSTTFMDLNLPLESENYYVVTAVNRNGVSSHRSAEINDLRAID